MQNIFLIGFMGCGKSTVAAKMQELYGMEICEMDQMIVHKAQMEIPEIFKQYGEEYFRDLESEILEEICLKSNQIVSCGGGVVLREQNRTLMKKNGDVVWLTAKPETILQRVSEDTNRPLLQGKKSVSDIKRLMEERYLKYKDATKKVITTDGKSISDICQEILEK